MEKDYKPKHHEKGMEKPVTNKPVEKVTKETKEEVKSVETKVEEKKESKKPFVKKEEVVSRGLDLRASRRHLMYISRFIKGKTIDKAIAELIEVTKMKRAIPYKGEIPHRKGSMMSGRYPVSASKQVIYMLKSLKGNAMVNNMDLDRTKISFGMANWAPRPGRKGGTRFKRSHLILKAKEFPEEAKK